MTYRREISFPMEPTKEDIKKLKREVARDKFGLVDGGKGGRPPKQGEQDGGDVRQD